MFPTKRNEKFLSDGYANCPYLMIMHSTDVSKYHSVLYKYIPLLYVD